MKSNVCLWVSVCQPSPLAAKFGLELDVVLRGGFKRREQINKTSHQNEGRQSWGRWILKQCLFFQPVEIIDRELLLLFACGGGKYIIILLNVLMKTAMIRERIRACNFLILRKAFDKWWNKVRVYGIILNEFSAERMFLKEPWNCQEIRKGVLLYLHKIGELENCWIICYMRFRTITVK